MKPIDLCNGMCFSGNHFSAPHIQPTIEQIDLSFGATHPGGKLYNNYLAIL